MSSHAQTVAEADIADSNTVADPVALYRTPLGFGISAAKLAAAASRNINEVTNISVPAYVKVYRRGTVSSEVPTLTEIGGSDCDFCIVPASASGGSVAIDDIFFINNRERNSDVPRYGTVIVSPGSVFGVFYRTHSDYTMLLYKVVDISEYRSLVPGDKFSANIARLDCSLVGHAVRNWRGTKMSIPDQYLSLYGAVLKRMRWQADAPVNIECWCMRKKTDELEAQFLNMNIDDVVKCRPDEFTEKLMNNVVEIRHSILHKSQQPDIDSDEAKKIARAHIHAKVILTLSDDESSVVAEVSLAQNTTDGIEFNFTFGADTFVDDEHSPVAERNLLLGCTTFAQLVTELKGRDGQSITYVSTVR